MNKEYLENYLSRENDEYEKLVLKKMDENSFDFENDRYPPDNRFVNLQRPITDSTARGCFAEDRWIKYLFVGLQ